MLQVELYHRRLEGRRHRCMVVPRKGYETAFDAELMTLQWTPPPKRVEVLRWVVPPIVKMPAPPLVFVTATLAAGRLDLPARAGPHLSSAALQARMHRGLLFYLLRAYGQDERLDGL